MSCITAELNMLGTGVGTCISAEETVVAEGSM